MSARIMSVRSRLFPLSTVTCLCRVRSLPLVTFALMLTWVSSGLAENIAPLGTAILGVKATVDTSPGIPLSQAGSLTSINDADWSTHVDNWSNGTDGGRGVSYVGVLWPSVRFESIQS